MHENVLLIVNGLVERLIRSFRNQPRCPIGLLEIVIDFRTIATGCGDHKT